MNNPLHHTEELFFVATKCCLLYDGKILILNEWIEGTECWWDIPGGRISVSDKTITPLGTLARELREELWSDLGIEQQTIDPFFIQKSYQKLPNQEHEFAFLFLYYRYNLEQNPKIHLSGKNTKYQWIWSGEIDVITLWKPGLEDVIRKVLFESL